MFRLRVMDKLKNLVVDTSLTGKLGIKYYLPKTGCVERIKKRLVVVETEEADKVVETNRGIKRETRQTLAKNNCKVNGVVSICHQLMSF